MIHYRLGPNGARWIAHLAIATLGVSFAFPERASSQAEMTQGSVWDGVYTVEQAERGQASYVTNCQSCHGATLLVGQGDMAGPALAGPEFMTQWGGGSVADLYASMRELMPLGQAGSLPSRVYLDILAYVFSVNGFPAGAEPLANETETLARIVIEEGVRQ